MIIVYSLICFLCLVLGYVVGRTHSEKLFISKVLAALKENNTSKPKDK